MLNEENKKCYPIIYLNDTQFNDTYIYVNVSVPTPYNIYLDKNVCNIVEIEYEEEKEKEKEREKEMINELSDIFIRKRKRNRSRK